MRKRHETIEERNRRLDVAEGKDIIITHEKIKGMPYETQIDIWHELNTYGRSWPEELLPKPEGWDQKEQDAQQYWKCWLQKFIEQSVGRKAIFRRSKKAENGWNDQQFEDWWDSFY